MNRIKGKDWIILVLDMIAVNAAYFLALLLRFYVNYEFRPTVSFYLTDFLTFAPFHTIICIAVFWFSASMAACGSMRASTI